MSGPQARVRVRPEGKDGAYGRGGSNPACLSVSVHPAVEPSLPEVAYTLRTLLRAAGYAYRLEVAPAEEAGSVDLHYGPDAGRASAALRLSWSGRDFRDAGGVRPQRLVERSGWPLVVFDRAACPDPEVRTEEGGLLVGGDLPFTAYWLLVGAGEPGYRRDARDNVAIPSTGSIHRDLLQRPLVSRYALQLRRFFTERGRPPLDPPWRSGALVLTHDVDYPEILRAVEIARLLRRDGVAALARAAAVARGRSHFWQFDSWVEWARSLEARPTFYFMARRGSPIRYAAGRPDAFYDVRSRRFTRLFADLLERGCEVGLHASWDAHASVERLARERARLEEAAATEVRGVRHHYWRLDPDAPHETLRRHGLAGLEHDSSLSFEFYPGFRRGTCHPFHPFHPELRQELEVLELPPAWMDDHFDRRRRQNGIEDPGGTARTLLSAAVEHDGLAVLDYHVRGMNEDFFPRYGRWLRRLFRDGAPLPDYRRTASEASREYLAYESTLDRASRDPTVHRATPTRVEGGDAFDVGPVRWAEIPHVARLHHRLFAADDTHGHSLAYLGREFLERGFYRPSLDDPHFSCDVARYDGDVVGFSVYSTRPEGALLRLLRRHAPRIAREALRAIGRRPGRLRHLLGNLRYLRDPAPSVVESGDAQWLVAGVDPECRTRGFERRTGLHLASELLKHMERTLRLRGVSHWYGVAPQDNKHANVFHERHGGQVVGEGREQGKRVNYWRKVIA